MQTCHKSTISDDKIYEFYFSRHTQFVDKAMLVQWKFLTLSPVDKYTPN